MTLIHRIAIALLVFPLVGMRGADEKTTDVFLSNVAWLNKAEANMANAFITDCRKPSEDDIALILTLQVEIGIYLKVDPSLLDKAPSFAFAEVEGATSIEEKMGMLVVERVKNAGLDLWHDVTTNYASSDIGYKTRSKKAEELDDRELIALRDYAKKLLRLGDFALAKKYFEMASRVELKQSRRVKNKQLTFYYEQKLNAALCLLQLGDVEGAKEMVRIASECPLELTKSKRGYALEEIFLGKQSRFVSADVRQAVGLKG